MIPWNKLHISDEAIQSAAEWNGITDDEAFDLLLALLECAHHAKFRGSDRGLELYRIENEYLYVKDMTLIRYGRRKYYSRQLREQLHEAEDGCCEGCGRRMTNNVVRVKRFDKNVYHDFNNYILLCPDCEQGNPDAVKQATIERSSFEQYKHARGISLQQAENELLVTCDNMIFDHCDEYSRVYDAPRLGSLLLENKALRIIGIEPVPQPLLKKIPQKRSRRRKVEQNLG